MANTDVVINVTAKQLECSVTNNFILEKISVSNGTVDNTVNLKAKFSLNCVRYTLSSIVTIEASKTYCIKFYNLKMNEGSETNGIGKLSVEAIEIDSLNNFAISSRENIIGIFSTDESGKFANDSLRSYPFEYNVDKLQASKQDKLTAENIGSGLGIDSNGNPYVPIDTDLSPTSESPIANNAVFNALDNKQAKQQWEIIRSFKVGDESTYNDNDILVYNDSGNLTAASICADKNGNPFHCDEVLIKVTYPNTSEIASNYAANCDPYSCVSLNNAGFPTNTNGYKFNNSYASINPANTSVEIIYGKIDRSGMQFGFRTGLFSSADSTYNWQIWGNSGNIIDLTNAWGKITKKVGINTARLFSNSAFIPTDTRVVIYGVRKDED